jgi:hypothetical protein
MLRVGDARRPIAGDGGRRFGDDGLDLPRVVAHAWLRLSAETRSRQNKQLPILSRQN